VSIATVSRRTAGAGLSALCLAPAIAVAMQAAAPPGIPSPASPLPADVEIGIGSFESRLISVEDDLIVRIYAQTLRERFADDKGGEAHVRGLLSSPQTIGGSLVYASARIEQGEFAGHWSFESPEGGLPTRAWRDIDRSGAQGYEVERVGHCRGEPAACAHWFASGRDRAPEPRTEAGERAERQWAARVMQEPCVVRPAFRPSTVSLQTAVSRAGLADAVVMLQLLHNGCGEVRQIRFIESSGDRGVDRAVVAWTRRLIAPPTDGWTGGYYSRLPFRLISLDGTDSDAEAPR
jgi:hypothetical protein